ncbi:hypothetical protein, partial [Moorena sp. SIO4A1]|uniref:hypothetical protein n=1 Tax=Moorena sp. SIO4A1 TaxID=2607835 RepID=UPI0025E85E46
MTDPSKTFIPRRARSMAEDSSPPPGYFQLRLSREDSTLLPLPIIQFSYKSGFISPFYPSFCEIST